MELLKKPYIISGAFILAIGLALGDEFGGGVVAKQRYVRAASEARKCIYDHQSSVR